MKTPLARKEYLKRLGETIGLIGGGALTLAIGLSVLGASFVCGIGAGVVFNQYPEVAKVLAVVAIVLFVVAGAICYRGFDSLWRLDQRDANSSGSDDTIELPDKDAEIRPDLPPTYLDRLISNRDKPTQEKTENPDV